MANYIQDNPDLQFYLDRWIDWEHLYSLSEIRDSLDRMADFSKIKS